MPGFMDALRNGEVVDARRLLQADPALAEYREPNGVSAVLLARYMGHPDLAREMADGHSGIDIFEAAALGDVHRTRDILAADPQAISNVNIDGFSPLGLAAYFGHLEEVRLLLDNGADPNVESANAQDVMPIHSALAGGHEQIVRLLVERGSEVNEPTGDDWTPLHYCAESNMVETARFLINAGARSGYPNKDGSTALEIAEQKGYRDLAAMLAESAE